MFISYILLIISSVLIKCNYGGYYSNAVAWDDNYEAVKNDKEDGKVEIKFLYEAHCPGSRKFYSGDFCDVVKKLAPHLDIYTYPYGNAKTNIVDGKVVITCQHGPKECYGNMLHACALDIIQNQTTALLYNSCMMEDNQSGRGSDDKAADKCGKSLNIDSKPIKSCAESDKGFKLLNHYGEESKKFNYSSVPHVLINGVANNLDNFNADVCAAFSNPPPACVH